MWSGAIEDPYYYYYYYHFLLLLFHSYRNKVTREAKRLKKVYYTIQRLSNLHVLQQWPVVVGRQ